MFIVNWYKMIVQIYVNGLCLKKLNNTSKLMVGIRDLKKDFCLWKIKENTKLKKYLSYLRKNNLYITFTPRHSHV